MGLFITFLVNMQAYITWNLYKSFVDSIWNLCKFCATSTWVFNNFNSATVINLSYTSTVAYLS